MKIIKTASEMSEFVRLSKAQGNQIAFVPTMGALHDGHVSLIHAGRQGNDNVVVSVFVNPKQFNNSSDLQLYPRTFESDRKVLELNDVDVMFFPSVEEIYQNTKSKTYSLDGLDERMEGPNRPGHFNGVVQVVSRLFDIVNPDTAYFGEKDFQQLAIIRHMTKKLGHKTNIIGCPTIREANGLAMSSRNSRLSEVGKELATQISICLFEIKNHLSLGNSTKDALEKASQSLNNKEGIKLEYLELVDPTTLKPASKNTTKIQACIAVQIEGVRLIDNMRVK